MTGFKFACHLVVIFDHLFGFPKCPDGRVAHVSKKFAS